MNLSRTLRLLPVFPLFALVIGCATPGPLVRLDPDPSANVVWIAGRASVQKESGGVRVATAFERQRDDHLGLRVEIANETDQRMEISPADVTFLTCANDDVKSCDPLRRRVVDPEQVLSDLDEKESRTNAEAQNTQVLVGSLALLSIAGDVATVASGRASSTTGLQTSSLADQSHATEASRINTVATIGQARELWSNAALRRNTLFPGHGTGGLVYVQYVPDARYVWLQVKVGKQVFPFRFRQTVTLLEPRPLSSPEDR